MNKVELINAISEKTGLSKAKTELTLNAFVDVLTENFQKGEKVKLVGFGKFYVYESPARRGISVNDRKEMLVPAKRIPKFKPGKELRKIMEN